MSIFFDFKTINELIGDNYYRQPTEFTLEDLSQYNENNGIVDILTNTTKTEFLIDDDYMSDINNMNLRFAMPGNRQIKQDTSKFTPDDWIRYIDPLVTYALKQPTQGMNTQIAYQKFILLGVLVGLGKTPQESINQVQEWQNTGASQLLKSGISTGGKVTSDIMDTGATGMGGITGTSGATIPTRQVKQDTSKFTPDDWIRYIAPLVTYALKQPTQGMNTQSAYQKFILLGVLVGLGKTPQEAINQVQEWQNTGASQLLKSGTSTGGTATSGIMGAGATGIGGNIGTIGNTMPTHTQVKQDTSKFTPDDWIRYIAPLVTYALKEPTQGMNAQSAYQKFILLGVLVGLGKTPQEALNQVQEWQNSGASQLLKSGTSTGGTGTSSVTRIEGSSVLPTHFTTFKFASDVIDIGGSTRTSDNTNKSNRLHFE